MSYEDASGQVPRRPRVGDGPPQVSGVVAIVLAAVAVIAGYLILRSITDGGNDTGALNPGGGIEAPETGSSTVPDSSDSVPSLPTQTTEPPPAHPVGPSKLIVANANGKSGSADQASRVLSSSAKFETVEPTNDTPSSPNIDTSLIYFDPSDPDAEAVAGTLKYVLGGTPNIAELPDPIPIANDGDMKGATVLLMLGTDFNEMAPGQLTLDGLGEGSAPVQTNPETESVTSSTGG